MYLHNNHCHRVTAHLQLNILYIIFFAQHSYSTWCAVLHTKPTVCPTLAFLLPNYCINATCFGPLSWSSSGSSQIIIRKLHARTMPNIAPNQRTVESQRCTHLENAVQVDYTVWNQEVKTMHRKISFVISHLPPRKGTYLLTPWSRVLLEKLTSKLCS